MADKDHLSPAFGFFLLQLRSWPQAAQNFAQLDEAESRFVRLGDCTMTLLHNPARMRSTGAKTDGKSLEARPCFLCASNRPRLQSSLPLGENMEILVNPFPILSPHFTVASRDHQRQSAPPVEMIDFVKENPSLTAFFNGARAGASAPDHLHFQAVCRNDVPLLEIAAGKEGIAGGDDSFPAAYIRLEGSESEMREALEDITLRFPGYDSVTGIADPALTNVFVYQTDDDKFSIIVIPRKAHRPSCFFATGDAQLMVSPGALDVAGLIVLPRSEDYEKITAGDLQTIFRETTFTAGELAELLEREREPQLRVGIIENSDVELSFTGSYRKETDGEVVCHVPIEEDSTAKVERVEIGKQFHWRSRRPFILHGTVEVSGEKGRQTLVNIIGIEDYLKSVISSEMNASAPIEFLKAHAIISRSWVIGKIYPLHLSGKSDKPKAADRISDWLDTADHKGFHVCADDHCQRYQGVAEVNEAVREAVDSTRGMVIADGSEGIIDARFSKCCGGSSERFSSCWQDVDYSYLEPVECEYCNPAHLGTERLSHLLPRILKSYDRATTDYFSWETIVSPQLVASRLKELYERSVGEIIDLVPIERGASGRIVYLKITGTEGELIIGKELAIRRILSRDCLYSSCFEISRTPAGDFLLSGRGWGHGVGLCQIGGAVMAEEGKTAAEIIYHYYPGTHLKKLY